jgi:hypothetical protein
MDDWIKIESGKVWIFDSDEQIFDFVVFRDMDATRPRVVKVGKSYSIFSTDLLANDNLVDVVKLVPIVIVGFSITVQRLEAGTTKKFTSKKMD